MNTTTTQQQTAKPQPKAQPQNKASASKKAWYNPLGWFGGNDNDNVAQNNTQKKKYFNFSIDIELAFWIKALVFVGASFLFLVWGSILYHNLYKLDAIVYSLYTAGILLGGVLLVYQLVKLLPIMVSNFNTFVANRASSVSSEADEVYVRVLRRIANYLDVAISIVGPYYFIYLIMTLYVWFAKELSYAVPSFSKMQQHQAVPKPLPHENFMAGLAQLNNLDMNAATFFTYKVQKGDTGNKIADKFGLSLQKLKQLNPSIDLENIKVGQILNI